jgi:GDP-L-fucose synthase
VYISCHPELNSGSILKLLGITANSVTLWGTGKPLREFLYVDDLASALLFLMENYEAQNIGEIINIGVGHDISIHELAELVKSIVGFDGEIFYDANKPDGVKQKLLDVTRINDLGWWAQYSLAEGIRAMYIWYCQANKACKQRRIGNDRTVEL